MIRFFEAVICGSCDPKNYPAGEHFCVRLGRRSTCQAGLAEVMVKRFF